MAREGYTPSEEKDMQTPPRAVIWDMDGTLIDSTEYHWRSWHDALAAENFELSYEQFQDLYGQRNIAIVRAYLGDDIPLDEIERISTAKETHYRTLVHEQGIELLPGVHDWLNTLREQGWQQAIATSAPRGNLDTIIDVLGIRHYFAALVDGEEVEDGKPDPQPFLLAARRLNVPPERCIVVEDSSSGIEAGKRGGMHTIGVLTSHDELPADIVVPTLDQLPPDAFSGLLST
jgi:beta-phosphoglucomutase